MIATTIVTLIATAGLLVALLLGIYYFLRTQAERHVHDWTKWGEFEDAQRFQIGNPNGVPLSLQRRTCRTCGLQEARELQVERL